VGTLTEMQGGTPQRDRKKGDQRVSLCCREKLWCWWSQGVGREAQG